MLGTSGLKMVSSDLRWSVIKQLVWQGLLCPLQQPKISGLVKKFLKQQEGGFLDSSKLLVGAY